MKVSLRSTRRESMTEPEVDEVECAVADDSGKAWLLTQPDPKSPGKNRAAWFPKSQIIFKSRNMQTGKAVAEIPVWLLEKEGWTK